MSATALLLSLLPAVAFAVPAAEAHASAPTGPLTEQSASQRAAATGEPVEVTSERTEYTTTMANPDGTFVMTQATEPQRARDKSGAWQDIDVTLEKRPDGTVGPKSAVVDLAFSGGGSGTGLLTLGTAGQRLKLGWPTGLPEPTLDGATATYADVPVKGVDLQLTATAEGYREVLVVKSAEAAASPELEKVRLTARGEGLSVTPGEGGGLRAVDEDGNAVFRGPSGQMWDSAGDTATAPTSAPRKGLRAIAPEDRPAKKGAAEDPAQPGQGDATADLPVTVGDGAVSVTPDLDLLRGKKTVYPVFIDPSVGLGRSEWTKLSSDGDKFWKFSEPKGVGRCGIADGYYCDLGGYTDRMYFEFGASKLAGKHVLDATFRAYETWSFNCQPHWVDLERTDNISEGSRWPGPKQLDQMGDRYVSAGRGNLCSPEQPNSWIEFNDNPDEKDENLASTVRSLANGKISRLTLMLRAKDEGEPRAWKRFDNNAELKVWYMHKPGVPTSVGAIPGTGNGKAQCRPAKDPVTVTVDTPKIQATVQTKVEQHQGEEEGSLQAEFVMERSSTDTTSGSWDGVWKDYKPDSGWDPDGTRETITTTKRADGGLYRFKARTQSHWVYGGKKGDLFSPYSKWCYLRIDSTAPKEPTIQSFAPYSECTADDCAARGGPGKGGLFFFRPNKADKDVKEYRWRLLTSDADATRTVKSMGDGSAMVPSLKPGLAGTQTLSVEASDLKKDKEGRVRWGPPAEFVFKVGAADGTTGRWRFDDAGPGSSKATANDTGQVGSRHDVVMRDEAGTDWSTLGRRGAGDYSLRLNDNQSDPDKQVGYASTDGVPVNSQSSFTVSAWAYLTDDKANRTVLSAPGEHGSAFTLYYSSTFKKWVFNRTDQDKDGPVYIRSAADAENPPLKVWTHLVGVFDTQDNADPKDDTIQLFVNGRPQGKPVVLADEAPKYTPWTADRNMMVGRVKVGGSYGDYFLGRIDEVATWQRPLEPDEIREENRLERSGLPTNELVGHWDATISSGGQVVESPEDPGDPSSAAFPYRRGPLDLSGSGARLTGDDATSLVLDGKSGYASVGGPVVDETGSFTVSARVRLTKAEFAGKDIGYRALVAGQATPAGKESSWALWVEKVSSSAYQWKFGRTAVNADGKVVATAVAPAEDTIGDKEWDTWVDVTGVFDAGLDFTDDEGDQRFGVARLYVGQFAQQGEDDAGLARAQQGDGALTVGRGSAQGKTGHYLPGDLAKLRVWAGAMNREQVTDQIAEPST